MEPAMSSASERRRAREPLAVLTTVGSLREARRLARSLIGQRLAACAQICRIESFYRWEGRVRHAPEYRLMVKSATGRYRALQAAIRAQHSYTLPAIYAVAVARSFAPYARWIEQSCRAASPLARPRRPGKR